MKYNLACMGFNLFSLIELFSMILDSSSPQRFSATANQLLENLKRRGGSTSSIGSLVKHYNHQQST